MSFLHLSLVAGVAVITVPLMLHMFGRRQPQQLDFPALRFVRETRQEQSTSWQLRHFLLLLLRVLLFGLLALALARPRVHSAAMGSVLGMSGLGLLASLALLITAVAFASRRPKSVWVTSGIVAALLWLALGGWAFKTFATTPGVPSADQSAPVAAAIIVDTGPSMTYTADNATRLEKAQEMATWILDKLPFDSQVGVLTGAPVASLSLDPVAAKSQIDVAEAQGAHIDLAGRISSALELVKKTELDRKEIYVLTDLNSSSWQEAQAGLANILQESRDEVLLQIIDVGEEALINWRLGDVASDLNAVPIGSDILVEVEVFREGDQTAAKEPSPVTVELLQEVMDPSLPRKVDGVFKTPSLKAIDRKLVEVDESGNAQVTLTAKDLQEGDHNFRVQIDQRDPLLLDNIRYLSVSAAKQPPTLVVASDPQIGRLLALLADPSVGEQASTKAINYSQLATTDLKDYGVVWLHDPPPIPNALAENLNARVLSGLGVLITLGPATGTPTQAASSGLQKLLPGKIDQPTVRDRDNRNAFLIQVAKTSSVFFDLVEIANDVPWNQLPVFQNWTLAEIDESSIVLMKVSDTNAPIMLLQSRGQGKIISVMTPIPELEQRGTPLWNELWIGEGPWAFALLTGAVRTLSGLEQDQLTFPAGAMVSLPNDPLTRPSSYQVITSDGQSRRVQADSSQLNLGRLPKVGTVYLRGQLDGPVARSLSVNAASSDTKLERMEFEQLQQILGADNFKVASKKSEIESSVGTSRYGRELYPLIMLFIVGLFLAEQAMSNRFYEIKLQRMVGA